MNFDLSKIYSEQVNKQKVYLNPYITESYSIIEEAKTPAADSSGSALVKHIMVLAFSNKDVPAVATGSSRPLFTYEGAEKVYRVAKNYEVSLEEFADLLQLVPDKSQGLVTEISNIERLPAGKKEGMSGSSQYPAISFSVKYAKGPGKGGAWTTKILNDLFPNIESLQTYTATEITPEPVMTYLMPAGKNDKSFSTPVKENLPGIIFNLMSSIPSLIGNLSKPKNSNEMDPAGSFLNKLTGTLSKGISLPGIPPAAIDRSYFVLEAFKGIFAQTKKTRKDGSFVPARVDAGRRSMLIGTASIARKLASLNFTPDDFFYIGGPDGEGIHTLLKSTGSKLSGLLEDQWCPADIFIVNKKQFNNNLDEFTNWLNVKIAEAEDGASAESARDIALSKYNGLFCPKFDPAAVSGDTPILAISLKQERSQGGKAKQWLRNHMKDICEVNFTRDERTQWSNETCVSGLNELCNNILQWCNNFDNVHVIPNSTEPAGGSDAFDFWKNLYYNEQENPWGGDDVLCSTHLKFKYGAVKILECAMKSGDPGIFHQTLLSGRKINGDDVDSVVPFFKLQENSNGLADLTREDGRTVEVNTPYEIHGLFSTTAAGLDIKMGCSELERGSDTPYNTRWKIKLVTQGKDAVEVETAKD